MSHITPSCEVAELDADFRVHSHKAQSVDANNDGIITFLEWCQSKEANRNKPWEKLAAQWERYDVERKGYLTIEEAFLRRG